MELTIELDEAREVMYSTLREGLDEEALEVTLERAVQQKITELYDNRENLVKQEN